MRDIAADTLLPMRDESQPQSWNNPWSLFASFALHIVAAGALLLLPIARLPAPALEESITVEVLTSRQFETETKKPVAERQSKLLAVSPSDQQVEKKPPEAPKRLEIEPGPEQEATIQATRLLSAKVLADPRSRQAREALPHLATDERMIQLCNVEALEQVRIWKADYQPDILVAYAMADTQLIGRTVKADGAAFRSKRRWYNIRFECEVGPDLNTVVAFEFRIGREIPRSEWQSHNLAAGDGEAD